MGQWPAKLHESGHRRNRSRDRKGAPSSAVGVGDSVVVRRFQRWPTTLSDCSALPGPEGAPSRLRLVLGWGRGMTFKGARSLAARTEVFDNGFVKGSEFLRKVKAVARGKKLTCQWVAERGSGSHGTFYLGGRFTVVKDLKKEIGPGLLSAMCRQLGIRKEDL